jgi:hypothetical protein
VLRGRGIVAAGGGVVEAGEDRLAATVAGLVEDRAVALGEIERLEDVEVGGVLDLPLRVARRLVEVDDGCVERVGGIERAMMRPTIFS